METTGEKRKHSTHKGSVRGKSLTVVGIHPPSLLAITSLVLITNFAIVMGIWKGLDEVRAQIPLIFLLCPCSLNIRRTLKAGSVE